MYQSAYSTTYAAHANHAPPMHVPQAPPVAQHAPVNMQAANHGSTAKGQYEAQIKAADMMDQALVQDCVDFASDALDMYAVEKDIAKYMKRELDRKHSPTWNVIVGKEYGSFIAHEDGKFCYFYIGPLAFVIFKLG